MNWIPPEKKIKVPEFNQYLGVHIGESAYDAIESLAIKLKLSKSVIVRSMIDHCLENVQIYTLEDE